MIQKWDVMSTVSTRFHLGYKLALLVYRVYCIVSSLVNGLEKRPDSPGKMKHYGSLWVTRLIVLF